MIAKNASSQLFSPQSIPENLRLPLLILLLISTLSLTYKKILKSSELLIIFIWIASVVLFFSISATPISEYYFANIDVLIVIIVSLLIYLVIKSIKPGVYIVTIFLSILFIKNLFFFVSDKTYLIGYFDRKEVINFIAKDAKLNKYPCVGITYISKFGDNFGFRYFFYLNKLHLIHPSLDIPVYNIVVPSELSGEVTQKFGHIGLILPKNIPSREVIEKSCQTPDTNLTDTMFGYVE
jgi:hypothetical protein